MEQRWGLRRVRWQQSEASGVRSDSPVVLAPAMRWVWCVPPRCSVGVELSRESRIVAIAPQGRCVHERRAWRSLEDVSRGQGRGPLVERVAAVRREGARGLITLHYMDDRSVSGHPRPSDASRHRACALPIPGRARGDGRTEMGFWGRALLASWVSWSDVRMSAAARSSAADGARSPSLGEIDPDADRRWPRTR
jgi:hypothetical protein